jgi:hypothetical protein
MKLSDFNTLEEAQAYTENGSRMVSPDMMVAFMATFQHINTIMSAVTEPAKALQLALQFGSEFNLINGHPASVKPLLDRMVVDGTVTQEFSDYATAYANPVKTPFANATQADWDKAQLQLNPTTKQEVSYPSADYILYKPAHRNPTSIEINITEALPYDDVITVICSSGNTTNAGTAEEPVYETNYSRNLQQRAAISIPANFTGLLDTTVNVSGLKTKVKVFATSQFQRTFTASVANVGA